MKWKQKYQVKLIFFKNKKQTQKAKQKQIYLEVLKVCLSLKFQLPRTKAPLPLIMTLQFRDFIGEHLSPVFTVLQLGTES